MKIITPGNLLIGILLGLLAMTLILSGIVFSFFINQIGCWPGDNASCQLQDIQSLALMGDYFSGVQGPVFDFAAFFAVLVALVIQQRQLSAQREESRHFLKLNLNSARKAELKGVIQLVYAEIDQGNFTDDLIDELGLLLDKYATFDKSDALVSFYRKRLQKL